MNYFYNFRSTGFWYQYFKKSCKQTVTLKGQSLKTIFFFKFHQLLDYERRIHASRTIFEPNLKWAEYLRTGQFCNAVEHEPVETRVLNHTASEASYKPKQRSYRKTNLKKKFWHRIVPAPKCPAPKCPAPKQRHRNGGAETYSTLNLLHHRYRKIHINVLYDFFIFFTGILKNLGNALQEIIRPFRTDACKKILIWSF